jgi:hypothetical protein
LGGGHPYVQVLAPQLRVARHRDGAHPEAGEHRQHPLDPAADQRHHGVAALHAPRRHRPREPGAACDQLAEVPLPPEAFGVDRDDPKPGGLGALENVLDEVHAPSLPGS